MIGVIPAAGKGVRFKELGRNYSKTILPYKEKPILIHQLEYLRRHGCDDLRVVINHAADTVIDILRMYEQDDVKIIYQEGKKGLAGAIWFALNDVQAPEPLFIVLGDLVITEDVPDSTFKHNFISVSEVFDYSRWCMVKDLGEGRLRFYDKPSKRPDTNLAVSGAYFVRNAKLFKEILDEVVNDERNMIANEFQISTALEKLNEREPIKLVKLKIVNFGTLDEYLKNRSVRNSRSFNEVNEVNDFIVKSSRQNCEKLIKEVNWFKNLPDDVKIHTPRLFDYNFFTDECYYKMEKIYAPTLRELYLFLDNEPETWEVIFKSIFDLLAKMERYGKRNDFLKWQVEKVKLRVQRINVPVELLRINQFIKDFTEVIERSSSRYALMHGDFCFSNLFFDYSSKRILMVDPRGELFGDHYYEIAKLVHSVLFNYDFIDVELYSRKGSNFYVYDRGKTRIQEIFKNELLKRYDENELYLIFYLCASLFLSMIPLHTHNVNNQRLFYDTFLKVYDIIRNENVMKFLKE